MAKRGKAFLFVLLVAACAPRALAHNPMTSWAVARLHADRVELEVELSAESAWTLLGGPKGSAPDVGAALPKLKELAPSLYRISAGGVDLVPTSVEVELREEDGVGFLLVYTRPAAAPLRFDASFLRSLPAGHRTALTLKDADDKVIRTEVLTAASSSLTADAGSSSSEGGRSASFRSFLKLGVEHILTGYDHLLFLFGLLVACRRFSTAAKIITCFTLAHSLTLALAALDIVSLPARVVEPLIAASIVFVGVENIVRRGEPGWRWALTFALGLVHGFGFAGALKEAGLGSAGSALLVPLFSFNLGVELGQAAVAAVALPLLWKLRDLPAFERYGRNVISAAIALAGAWWFVTRLFL
ncbi:MAG TPA: HupE/UreJ family protein [Pyrinomonadaceae bacterium]|nr:HupE/UreJ family protein [Pyrinomonadaceae bacterium]